MTHVGSASPPGQPEGDAFALCVPIFVLTLASRAVGVRVPIGCRRNNMLRNILILSQARVLDSSDRRSDRCFAGLHTSCRLKAEFTSAM
jgi:hypothetical protein